MASKKRIRTRTPKLSKADLRAMLEDATVDACGEAEEISGIFGVLDQELELPFETQVLGVTVEVVALSQRGLGVFATCRRGRAEQRIELADLPIPSPAPLGAAWIAVYAHWASSLG